VTMRETYIATAGVCIKAPAAGVWKALTDPAIIQQYLFGTRAVSDWKPGSSITYTGMWQGKTYEDKGRVVEVIENKLLRTTYWSSLSSRPDTPENYHHVTYTLAEKRGHTTLTVRQDNNTSRESAEHSELNWKTVLGSLKAIVERDAERGAP
jgi:uncharacterized protein YndB with AHSA1/START domain